MLAPELRPGDIVVMDNLAAHKVAGIAKAISDRGAELRYLPPYPCADFIWRIRPVGTGRGACRWRSTGGRRCVGGLAQEGLELGEGLLDRIEIGGVLLMVVDTSVLVGILLDEPEADFDPGRDDVSRTALCLGAHTVGMPDRVLSRASATCWKSGARRAALARSLDLPC